MARKSPLLDFDALSEFADSIIKSTALAAIAGTLFSFSISSLKTDTSYLTIALDACALGFVFICALVAFYLISLAAGRFLKENGTIFASVILFGAIMAGVTHVVASNTMKKVFGEPRVETSAEKSKVK